MGHVILHIGPQKCGSSTIQRGMSQLGGKPSSMMGQISSLFKPRNSLAFHMLDPLKIHPLNKPSSTDSSTSYFKDLLSKINADTVVLSHEVLFILPRAVGNLAKIASEMGHTTMLLGYSRKQNDFLRSSFCQWMFRDREYLRKNWDSLSSADLDPSLFSALERHLIAYVVNTGRIELKDRRPNWYYRYRMLEEETAPFGTTLNVGHLPSSSHPFSLIDDALTRCGIHANAPSLDAKINEQFNLDLIEAVAAACLADHPTPGPHDENPILIGMSQFMPEVPVDKDGLMANLNAFILGSFWEDNVAFCDRFDLDPSYFAPPHDIDRDTVLGMVREEHDRRRASPSDYIKSREKIIAALTQLSLQQARGVR